MGVNQRIADRLLEGGRIRRSDHQKVVEYARRHHERIEDALIDLGVISELELLRFLATSHGTQFVSTEKLSKASIDPRLLAKVPRQIAEPHGVFPVILDEAAKILSVVTADPDNGRALDEVRFGAGVREVKALVCRPAAVRAAILRHYANDPNAFAAVLRGPDVLPDLEPPSSALPGPAPARAAPARSSDPARRAPARPSDPARVRLLTPPPIPVLTGLVAAQRESSIAPSASPSGPAGSARPSAQAGAGSSLPAPRELTATPEYLETLNVLVSLLEASRPGLRGHSATVARLTRKMCEAIGLSPAHVAAFVAAAHVHDLGKMNDLHLTALNLAQHDDHRAAATKVIEFPTQLMASAGLPPESVAALRAMYERYDGRGLPGNLAGKEIPLGARILAIVDSYADLTSNTRVGRRRPLRPAEACDVLAGMRGTVFDPTLLDVFRAEITGDDIRKKLLAERHRVLLADGDPEETAILELRLIEQGFEVTTVRTAVEAGVELASGEYAVVVSEVDLEDAPDGGLALRARAIERGLAAANVTWVILTGKTDRQTAQRAFELGVDDVVSKPTSPDIFVTKLRQLIDRRAARAGEGTGVSGSLAEMSLPDIVQILWHGRKTCALRVQARGSAGEIHFVEGQIHNASWGTLRGEAAFYRMLALSEGDFRVDPSFKQGVRSIHATPEALLLEGMRRLDEGADAE